MAPLQQLSGITATEFLGTAWAGLGDAETVKAIFGLESPFERRPWT